MKTIPIESFEELKSLVSQTEHSYLLLYKKGSQQSECALSRITELESGDKSGEDPRADKTVLIADVTSVRDIHEKLHVDTAPSLVVFRQNRMINIIKGCQTKSAYDSILAGRELGAARTGETGKARQVTVYSTPTCSWCTTLKTYLDGHRIAYREVNVASDRSAAEAMVRKSGQQGVPQTEINGQMVVGFDKARINQLLEIQ